MTSFDWQFPYPSQRMPVLARNAVATSQPLAAQAGIAMLLKGGNAVDAALATAITLTVVEPTSNGIGSDAFCILWDGKKLQGLNASGRSPAAWTLERFKGLRAMPTRGWDAITVPGAVSAWVALSERYGKLPFADLFEPAIRYATDGYPHHRATVGEADPRAARRSRIRRALHAERSRAGGGREIRRPGTREGARAHRANERRGFLPGRARRKDGGARARARRRDVA
jgi:gamma-glutamyltranspeptidase